jgi:O-antigen/teichoic acid export membrane protein
MTLFTTAPRLLVDRLLQKFGRAAGLVLLARVLQNLNGFLLSILIVRRFGLQGAGTLVIATIAIVILALIGTCGLPYTLARMNIDPKQRNTVGLFACMAVVPLSLPFVGALGLIVGHSHKEALVIALLALGGPFFAQTNITNALQVLLNKPGDAIIPPIGNLLGLIVAAWVGPGFVTFAAILAAFRFAAIGCAFLRLPCRRTSFRMLITHMADGARYLIADAINLGTDQAAMLILSFILSRAQLGLLGLCRQLITVSDTPGWSQIQAFYPGMVADPARNGPLLISRLRWIGIVSAASVALLTAPLGLWIYRAPGFLVLAPLLQVSTPIRYLLAAYDTRLRALGLVAASNRISAIRGVLTLAIIPAGAWAAGAFGAVVAIIIQVVLATYLTRRVPIYGTQPALKSFAIVKPIS